MKIYKLIYGFIDVAAALIIAGCSLTDDRVAGTAGSETVNTYTLIIVDSQKQPIHGASVRLIENDMWLKNVCDKKDVSSYKTLSGSDGIVKIPCDTVSGDLNLNLLVDSGNRSAFLPFYRFLERSSEIQDTIVLKKSAQLSGTLTVNGAIPDNILLTGTDYVTIVKKSAERFNFAAVAPGTYKIMAAASDTHKVSYVGAREVELLEGDNYQMQVATDFTGVLIDDFDSELNLMNYLNSGNWYITKDGNVSVDFPPDRDEDTMYIPFSSAVVSDGAYEGKSVHVGYRAGSGTYYYLIIGAEISSRDAGFSNIDTISFMAKGNGTLKIRLHCKENNNLPEAIHYVNLDTAWQRFAVNVDQFTINDPENPDAVWVDVKNRMNWIAFHPEADGTDFWLDNVRMEGVTLGDLIIP